MPRWSVERFRDISGKFRYPIPRTGEGGEEEGVDKRTGGGRVYALIAEFHGSWPARLLRGRSPRANERESDSLIKEEKFWVEESYNAANHAAGCTFRARNEPHLVCTLLYRVESLPFPKTLYVHCPDPLLREPESLVHPKRDRSCALYLSCFIISYSEISLSRDGTVVKLLVRSYCRYPLQVSSLFFLTKVISAATNGVEEWLKFSFELLSLSFKRGKFD